MTEITWLRHSKANSGPVDHVRGLSEDGVTLALQRRKKLGKPTFDMVIHSGRVRTQQTARIVAGLADDAPTITIPQLMTVDGDSIGDKITLAYNKLGNASLEAYRQWVPRQLDIMAHMAMLAINDHVFARLDRPNKVLIVGHSIMTSAICDATGRHFANEQLEKDVLGECEGYIVTYGGVCDWTDFKLVK